MNMFQTAIEITDFPFYYFQISHMDSTTNEKLIKRHNIQDLAIYLQRQLFSVNSFGAAGLRLQIRNHTTLLTYSYHATLNGIHANVVDYALNNYSVNVMTRGHLPSVSYIHTELVPRTAEEPKQVNQTISNGKYYFLFAPP